jgi:hypothetical protein
VPYHVCCERFGSGFEFAHEQWAFFVGDGFGANGLDDPKPNVLAVVWKGLLSCGSLARDQVPKVPQSVSEV